MICGLDRQTDNCSLFQIVFTLHTYSVWSIAIVHKYAYVYHNVFPSHHRAFLRERYDDRKISGQNLVIYTIQVYFKTNLISVRNISQLCVYFIVFIDQKMRTNTDHKLCIYILIITNSNKVDFVGKTFIVMQSLNSMFKLYFL